MKNIQSFEEFILENQIFEATDFSGKRVVIFPGRYQPVHSNHVKAWKKASEIFKCPVVPIQIISKSEKSPFPESLLTKIGNAVTKEFNFIGGFVLYPQDKKTVIPQMVKYLREDLGFEAISMGCGSDRVKAYEPQIKYLNSEKSDVEISEPFKLEVCDVRAEGGPSGTKVREAIIADDKDTFEKMTPKSVHPFYNELKKYLK